jgi:hypothetical protein
MTDFPLTGGCNCGAVRFEVTAPLVIASYCHCKRCQRRCGAAASANAHPAPDTFRIVSGEDRLTSPSRHAAALNNVPASEIAYVLPRLITQPSCSRVTAITIAATASAHHHPKADSTSRLTRVAAARAAPARLSTPSPCNA